MSRLLNLQGKVFGRLTVIERAENNKQGRIRWRCLCKCGNEKVILSHMLTSGRTKSCGCFQQESRHNHTKTHNLSGTRTYKIWLGIKSRCYYKKCESYGDYGKRGITMCDEWKNDFMSFYNWAMNNGYSDNLTIDRIDVNGNYEPSNCRWADKKEQANNRRSNRLLTYNGKTQNITKWAKETNIPKYVIGMRLDRLKWTIERTLTEPMKTSGYTFNGKTQSLNKWSKELNINIGTLRSRIFRDNWTIEKAFSTPVRTTKK